MASGPLQLCRISTLPAATDVPTASMTCMSEVVTSSRGSESVQADSGVSGSVTVSRGVAHGCVKTIGALQDADEAETGERKDGVDHPEKGFNLSSIQIWNSPKVRRRMILRFSHNGPSVNFDPR